LRYILSVVTVTQFKNIPYTEARYHLISSCHTSHLRGVNKREIQSVLSSKASFGYSTGFR